MLSFRAGRAITYCESCFGSFINDYFKLHFIIFIWGFTAILGALISLEALPVVLYRTGFAALFTAGFILLNGTQRKLPFKETLYILAIGGIVGLHWLLFFASIKTAGASVALAGLSTVTLFTALLEPLMNARRPDSVEVIIGCVVVFGLYLVFSFQFNHAFGLSLAIGCAILGALFSILNVDLANKYSHHTITMYEMTGACIVSALGIGLVSVYDHEINLRPSWRDLVWILLLAGVCTAYAHAASVELLKRLSVFTTNLSVNLEPIYGIIMAALILGEHKDLHPGFYAGTSVIVFALLLHPILKRAQKKRLQPVIDTF